MSKSNLYFIIVIAILIIVVIFSFNKRPTESKPVYIKGKDSIIWKIDTIHDTTVSWKKGKDILDTIFVIKNDTIKDTIRCWQFGEKEKDGAIIDVKVCSDSLPEKPKDLICSIEYIQPEFDSIKTITRTDTVIVKVVKKEIFKKILIGTVAALCGIGAGTIINNGN